MNRLEKLRPRDLVRLWAVCLSFAAVVGAEPGGGVSVSGGREFGVVLTGGELLRGVYRDSHLQFLTRVLQPLGFRCARAVCVDDDPDEIAAGLRFAGRGVPLAIVTGGLGPTDDDMTRQALEAATGVRLRFDKELADRLAARCGVPPEKLPPHLRRQALVPTRGGWLPNPRGSAVGLVFDLGKQLVVALPGPPSELRPMASRFLTPLLRRRFGVGPEEARLRCRFAGIRESALDAAIHSRLKLPRKVRISSLFARGRVDVTFYLPGNDPEAERKLAELRKGIEGALGSYLYAVGEDSLEEVLLKRIAREGGVLSTVEGTASGALGAALHSAGAFREAIGPSLVLVEDPALRGRESLRESRLAAWAKARLRACGGPAPASKRWTLVIGWAAEKESNEVRIPAALIAPGGAVHSGELTVRPGELNDADWLVSKALLWALNVLRNKPCPENEAGL